MKQKTKFTLAAITLVFTFTIGQNAYSQEFVPLGALAQEFLMRTTEGVTDATNLDDATSVKTLSDINIEKEEGMLAPLEIPKDTIIVNPEVVFENAITESIDTITRTTQEIDEEKEDVIESLKQSVKEDIDTSIIEIRRQTNKEAYELQRVIDDERTQLFENITRAIESVKPVQNNPVTQTNQIEQLKQSVESSIRVIKENLETEAPQVEISFDRSQKEINNTLTDFEENLEQKRKLIETREGALIYLDSDLDDISDYDELYIYGTNPDNAFTREGELNDGQKVMRGINPLSETNELKQRQDPREDQESFVSDVYKVKKVELLKEEKKLVFEGVGLPNSFVTLYIYSTPIIVTAQTDSSGKWTYELEEELENGEHQIYVATVDSTGKIVARSNPILFTKSAEAASIGITGSINTTVTTQNFLQDNFILITLAILIAVVILGMMFVGNHRNISSAISELKNEVNSKE